MEFANPLFMAVGGALVSAPILIHLINRMRFKRVRWAAMEFLLKSQKRNRRKLIIEQLILLALRCFLVMLAGFLLARFQFGKDTGQNSFHLVVLDNTLSMSDRFAGVGKATNSFEVAKQEVRDLAHSLAEAKNGQRMRVALLSQLDEQPLFDKKIDDASLNELDAALEDPECKIAYQHVPPFVALEAAQKALDEDRALDARLHRAVGKKFVHFISDFRESDWKEYAEKLSRDVDTLGRGGAYVSLVDVAHPFRDAAGKFTDSHPNLSVDELRSESSIAIDNTPVEFTVGVFNHSGEPKQTGLRIFTRSLCVNDHGQIDDEQGFVAHPDVAPQADSLPPNQLTELKFKLTLRKKQKPQDYKDDKAADVRLRKRLADTEFVQVRVQIEDTPGDVGLALDNARDAVVALQHSVPVLVVDGAYDAAHDASPARKVNGDLWYLRRALDSSLVYEMEYCKPEDLDKTPLDRYPDIFLVNVPALKDDTVQKLADYVAKGGGLAYFLGDLTKPDAYNRLFFNKDDPKDDQSKPVYSSPGNEPLFPVLLADEPSKPMSDKEAADRLVNDKQPKILFPDEDHPIIRGHVAGPGDRGGLVKLEDRLRFLTVRRYWPCLPRTKWERKPETQEVVVLPNRGDLGSYKHSAQALMANAIQQTDALSRTDKKFEPYVARLSAVDDDLRKAIAPGKSYLDDLISVMDEMMNDPGSKDAPVAAPRPNMPDLWAQPTMRALKDEIDAFRSTLKYGDPLVVTRPFGQGRVLAFLTTAGTMPRGTGADAVSWNDWAGSPIAGSYPVFIRQMQDYLIATSEPRTQLVGSDVALPQLDAASYQPQMQKYFFPQTPLQGGDERPKASPDTLTMQAVGPDDARVFHEVEDGKQFAEPGVYVFAFQPNGLVQPSGAVLQAYAFNVDSRAESDLTRAPVETLLPKASGGGGPLAGGHVALRSPGLGLEQFKEEPPDASEMIWLFLLIGLVFVAEQALAVHLSFHLKEGETVGAAPPRQTAAA